MQNSDYVDGVLKGFIAEHQGRYLDHSHAYGPQSPDLIEFYLTELLGRPWQFRAGGAAMLWTAQHEDMADFERVERGAPLRPGDVLVFDGAQGYGTVGIYVSPGSRLGSVNMVTQNPGPVQIVDMMTDGYVHKLLGAWRLTHGGECSALVAKFQQQLGYGAETIKPAPPVGGDDCPGCSACTGPTAHVQRIVETTTPAETGRGHWVKRLLQRGKR